MYEAQTKPCSEKTEVVAVDSEESHCLLIAFVVSIIGDLTVWEGRKIKARIGRNNAIDIISDFIG